MNSQTLLSDIINLPGGEEVLAKYQVPCLTCPMAQFELASLKLGDVCQMYSLDEKKILAELNQPAVKTKNPKPKAKLKAKK